MSTASSKHVSGCCYNGRFRVDTAYVDQVGDHGEDRRGVMKCCKRILDYVWFDVEMNTCFIYDRV